MAEKDFLISPSGEISIKKPATRDFLLEKLKESLTYRLSALGFPIRLFEFSSSRFLITGADALKDHLLTHCGIGRIANFYKIDQDFDIKAVLPKGPFTYEIYVTKVRNKSLFEKALALKRNWLTILEKEAKARLVHWDNHPPVHLRLEIEVNPDGFLLLVNPKKALGGFPAGGFSEKVLVLFSGGPDSLLAACLMLRRGLKVALLFFDDAEHERYAQVMKIASGISYLTSGLSIELFKLDYRIFLEFLAKKAPKREICFLCKRLMISLAARLAREKNFQAFVTGDILGEQASQTLPALSFVAKEVSPLRPLIGFTKDEVYEKLAHFGLRSLAEKQLPPCPFAPKRPHTVPQIKDEIAKKILIEALRLPFQLQRKEISYKVT